MPAKNTKYVVAIGGPTAVGKSALATALARSFGSAIVSADSRQMYRQMTIGTAKPSETELTAAPHYFIDTLEVTDVYSVGRYETEALATISDLHQQHQLVILVGGSGLYLNAVLDGLDKFPHVPDSVRGHWEEQLATRGLDFLQSELKRLDPEYHAKVDLLNPRRLTRALSVITVTGAPFSAFHRREGADRPFTSLRIFCNLARETLYARINARVEEMLSQGLLEEARSLYPYRDHRALQTVGYQELFGYIDEQYTLEEAVSRIKQHTRNYAKRQVTWFRNQGEWKEFNPPDPGTISKFITHHIT